MSLEQPTLPPDEDPPPQESDWSLRHWDLPTALLAAFVFGGFYVASSVAAVLVSMGPAGIAALARAQPAEIELTLAGLVVNWTGLAAGGVFAALLLPRMMNGAKWSDLGFRSAGARWMLAALVLGVVMAFARLPLAEFLLQVSPQFAEMARELQDTIMPQRDPLSLVVLALMTVLIVPLYEELVFRSYVQSALRRILRPWGAILVSSLLFSLYHLVPLQVIVVFPLALVLAWMYERTRSLWPCVVAHMANNAVAIGLAIFWG